MKVSAQQLVSNSLTKLQYLRTKQKLKPKFGTHVITILSLSLIVAGSEKYRSITTGHYRFALGAVLMYDICNGDTFKDCRYWLDNVRTYADENVVIALVGKFFRLY